MERDFTYSLDLMSILTGLEKTANVLLCLKHRLCATPKTSLEFVISDKLLPHERDTTRMCRCSTDAGLVVPVRRSVGCLYIHT